MQMSNADVSKDANSVPGFPQDAFMESPAMAMDAAVAKPETYGLRPGWSGYMQGMMTLIRVLPSDQYDHIVNLRENPAHHKSGHDAQHAGSTRKVASHEIATREIHHDTKPASHRSATNR